MKNSTLKEYNCELFGKICMLGYEVSKHNPLTMHHIIPLHDGGKTNFENSSNASYLGHGGIHILSDDDYRKEQYIQDYLHYFKQTSDYVARKEFYLWIVREVHEMEYEEVLHKGKLLMYKRRNN